MNVLENNLNLLSKKNPNLAQKIASHDSLSSQFSLEESRSGDPNLKKNNYFLHDIFDPEQEAINLLNAIKDKHSQTFNFIYGLGLGYVLKRFNKKLNGYIIVYEPDLDVLRLTFEMVDFTDELSNPKVLIFDNLDDTEATYPKYFFYGFKVTTSICQTYKENELETAQEFVNRLGYIHGIYDSNYNTYWDKHRPWISSLIDNLENITKYNELKILTDKFKNKPALIISAGPSLNKNIETIAKYQDNFVIFCVGTALKSALKYGIKPDFICFIEFVKVTKEMIDKTSALESNIILQPITLNEIFDIPSKNKFVFYADNDEASKWAAKKFNINQDEYVNRGTVSVNALVSAKILGCNPIVLVGQDLAYTDSKCYADGSIYEDYKVENGVVSTDIEKTIEKTKVSKDRLEHRLNSLTKQLYHVKGQNGETLISPGDYASFIKYFEEIANNYSLENIKLVNATEGGAQINGYENMKFFDVAQKFASTPIEKDFTVSNKQTDKYRQIIKKEIFNALKLYELHYRRIFAEGKSILAKIDYDPNNINNAQLHKALLASLLRTYKKLLTLPKSDLLALIIKRNTFFIDYYLKNFDDDTSRLQLINQLVWLFDSEYDDFIKPMLDKLMLVSKKFKD